MWPALFLTSNHSHIRQLQFATRAFSQKVLQQAVQISICQWSSSVGYHNNTKSLRILVRKRGIRDLRIDDAASLDGAVLICMNKKSFLKCGNCNKRLKLILVTCKQFCLAKRCPICYKMDFQNTSHVVAFIVVAQGNYTDYLGMMLIVHCALLKKIIMLINSQTIIETLKLYGKQQMIFLVEVKNKM